MSRGGVSQEAVLPFGLSDDDDDDDDAESEGRGGGGGDDVDDYGDNEHADRHSAAAAVSGRFNVWPIVWAIGNFEPAVFVSQSMFCRPV